jgi:hypothetical protein
MSLLKQQEEFEKKQRDYKKQFEPETLTPEPEPDIPREPTPNEISVKWGICEKLGEVWKTWNARYFVLKQSGDLEYYKGVAPPKKDPNALGDISKGQLKGAIKISVCRFTQTRVIHFFIKIQQAVKGKPYCLEIELVDRHFLISYKSEKELLSWKSAFIEIGSDYYDISLIF